MREMVGQWPRSPGPTWRSFWKTMRRPGGRTPQGGRHLYRWEWISWAWKCEWRKWLLGPLRCKFGTHRVGPGSDTGMGG